MVSRPFAGSDRSTNIARSAAYENPVRIGGSRRALFVCEPNAGVGGVRMTNEHEQPTVRRIPTSGIHVAVKIDTTSEHTFWSDLTMNVEAGGVFVATFHPLAMGTIVHMLVTLEGEDVPFAASGVVRWTRPHRDGS